MISPHLSLISPFLITVPTRRPWTSWAASGCWNVNGKGAYPSWSPSEMSTAWLQGHLPSSISSACMSQWRMRRQKNDLVTWKVVMILKVDLWSWASLISFKEKLTCIWIMTLYNSTPCNCVILCTLHFENWTDVRESAVIFHCMFSKDKTCDLNSEIMWGKLWAPMLCGVEQFLLSVFVHVLIYLRTTS